MNQSNERHAVNGAKPSGQTGTAETIVRAPTIGEPSIITPIPARGPTAVSLPSTRVPTEESVHAQRR